MPNGYGIQTATFMDGAMRGYDFMDRIQSRQEDRERTTRQETESQRRYGIEDARAKEVHDANMATHQRQQEEADQQKTRQEAQRQYQTALYAHQNGVEPPEDTKAWLQQKGINFDHMLSPEYEQAVGYVEQIASGKAKLRSPQGMQAINTFYRDRLNRNAGQPAREGGTIQSARVVNYVPAADGKNWHFQLEVTAQKEDGTSYKYTAPMTKNRSAADDDTVMSVSTADLASDAGARVQMHKELKKALEMGVISAGGTVAKPELAKLGKDDRLVDPRTQKVVVDIDPSVKNGTASGKTPADVQTAEWLMRENPKLSREQALEIVNTSMSDPTQAIAKMSEALTIDPVFRDKTPEERWAKAEAMVLSTRERIYKRGNDGKKDAPQSVQLPKEAVAKLKPGVMTTFKNGQVWTIGASGQPEQVQ